MTRNVPASLFFVPPLEIDAFLREQYWARKRRWRENCRKSALARHARAREERQRKAVASLEAAWDARIAANGKKAASDVLIAARRLPKDERRANKDHHLAAAMDPGVWYRIGELAPLAPGRTCNAVRRSAATLVRKGLVEMKCFRGYGTKWHDGRAKYVYCLTAKGEALRSQVQSQGSASANDREAGPAALRRVEGG